MCFATTKVSSFIPGTQSGITTTRSGGGCYRTESPALARFCWDRCSSQIAFGSASQNFIALQDGSTLRAYIQYFEERMGAPRSFSVAGLIDAILLMTTTGIAFGFILNGRVQQHRQWMTRSFAVALVFLEVRVVQGVTGWENLGLAATETVVWSCLAFSLLSADIVLQVQELWRSRPAPAKAQAVRA